MNGAPVAVRLVAAIGLMLLVAALVYAVSSGRVFLFPFLLLLGVPMAAVFRRRNDPQPPGAPPGSSPPMSFN